MSRARAIFAALALGLFAGLVPVAAQEPADRSQISVGASLIGQRSVLTIEVVAPAGAAVEVDPAAETWAGVEVVRIESVTVTPAGDRELHRLELLVAPFIPGDGTFAPAVNVIEGAAVSQRVLPPVSWTVIETLAPGAPLELLPPAPPVAIDGAESPFLRPAIAAGAVAGVALLAGIVYLSARLLARRPSRPVAEPEGARELPGLAGIEGLIGTDPVAAYRALGATIRTVIGERYGFPAQALTASELHRRMEGAGIDRWQARLVEGLLRECDAVIYAGYQPAMERRQHDLTMAREIVGEAP